MQTSIFDTVKTLDDRFREFHEENPQVYERLVGMTYDLAGKGRKKIGMKMLFEVIRWRTLLETTDPIYKLNNSYASRYARMIVDDYPEFTGLFEYRNLKS